MEMDKLLSITVEKRASDLHLSVGRPPVLRTDGRLVDLDFNSLTPDDTISLMKSITSAAQQEKLQGKGGVEFGFAFGEAARFRVSIFRERGRLGLALRLIPSQLLTFEQIGLPPTTIKELLQKPRGLILVTGPTGSGKTTTLATMIDFINQETGRHIITIEDPIEYYHEHRKSLIVQREVGVDVPSFSEAVIRALRQDPDIIFIGEMREIATMEAAITAAETGHLVFSTLHTTGAAKTVDRIIDAFPTTQQEQIRLQVSGSILAVISQALLPKTGGGRIAAFEIMVSTPAIQNLIREKKTYNIVSAIETGRKYGMRLLDQHLLELHQRGLIRQEDMMGVCSDLTSIRTKLDAITRKR
ncbi:type IV pilus twitching motility protein PilT [candidate division NPL-UPA2 bacterium Unc8]|uniref:Type IV pilus twitching motility protein PilT n=1 Tax=candidate division NPL-UPA2 bacterium Unc8 TaxID=1980939 RepID=A0A399FY95_UNCN2|nr:Twitching mobility protein [Bacillota bacterium]MBT9146385.1 Twitching mobility protein [Bacillota bacterium]RII01087.1 MAG: type IV pilus twitching motility protein PilT [candidate division NPL-UPA2 bacterium Unc8]